MWEIEKESEERQEEREMKRRKFELEVEEKRRQAEQEMEERRQEAERKHEERTCSWVSWKNHWGGQTLIPQLEDTHLTILAQAPIPIQWDIKQLIMGQDLIHLPHAQGMHLDHPMDRHDPSGQALGHAEYDSYITLTTSKGYLLILVNWLEWNCYIQ